MNTKKPELSSERLLEILAAVSGGIRLPWNVSLSWAGFVNTARTEEVGNLLELVLELLLLLKDSDKTMLL